MRRREEGWKGNAGAAERFPSVWWKSDVHISSFSESVMLIRVVFVFTITWLAGGASAAGARPLMAELETFNDRSGRELRAEVLEIDEKRVHVRREDGAVFDGPLTALSDPDRAMLMQWFMPDGETRGGLYIHSAYYGCEGAFVEVTQVLRDRLIGNFLRERSGTRLAGSDPAPGRTKETVITYYFAGKKRQERFRDGTMIRLPGKSDGATSDPRSTNETRNERAEPPESPPGEIKLMSGWKSARRKGEEENVIADLREIFGRLAFPSDNTRVEHRMELYRDVRLLDSIEVARTKLRLKTLSKADCILPGFPNRSFSVYQGSGEFDGHETIMFLADTQNQVVGVQLSTSRKMGYGGGYDRKFLLHDMFAYSMRGVSNARVEWRGRKIRDGLVVLHSGFSADKRSHATVVYLPEVFVSLVLWNLETNW